MCVCTCRGQAIALDVARGLAYLHQCNVLHLDIKSGARSWCHALLAALLLLTPAGAMQPTSY